MHIDFLGPLTQTLNGNSYVGLAVCALTKYVEAAGKIANTKLTFFKHQNTLEIQTYYNRGGSDLRFWRSEISIAKEFLSGGAMTGMTVGGKAIFAMT